MDRSEGERKDESPEDQPETEGSRGEERVQWERDNESENVVELMNGESCLVG